MKFGAGWQVLSLQKPIINSDEILSGYKSSTGLCTQIGSYLFVHMPDIQIESTYWQTGTWLYMNRQISVCPLSTSTSEYLPICKQACLYSPPGRYLFVAHANWWDEASGRRKRVQSVIEGTYCKPKIKISTKSQLMNRNRPIHVRTPGDNCSWMGLPHSSTGNFDEQALYLVEQWHHEI